MVSMNMLRIYLQIFLLRNNEQTTGKDGKHEYAKIYLQIFLLRNKVQTTGKDGNHGYAKNISSDILAQKQRTDHRKRW